MKLKLPETPIQPSQQKTPFWQKTRKALRSLAAGGPEKPFDGREFCLQLAAALLTFALMLAFAGGFLLCRQITQYVRSNTKGMMKPLMLNLLRVFILHILPLLAVAAVAEVYVTPHVMALFM